MYQQKIDVLNVTRCTSWSMGNDRAEREHNVNASEIPPISKFFYLFGRFFFSVVVAVVACHRLRSPALVDVFTVE